MSPEDGVRVVSLSRDEWREPCPVTAYVILKGGILRVCDVASRGSGVLRLNYYLPGS